MVEIGDVLFIFSDAKFEQFLLIKQFLLTGFDGVQIFDIDEMIINKTLVEDISDLLNG